MAKTNPPPRGDQFRAVRQRLKAWRAASRLTGAEIHTVTSISPSFWSDLESGRAVTNARGATTFKRPDGFNALLIEVLTGGAVRADEWLTLDERRLLAHTREVARRRAQSAPAPTEVAS